jgi:DNA polymerase-3 subunit delta
MSSRLREAHRVAEALDAGQSPAQVRKTLRMPSKAAEQLIGDARRAGADRLRAAVGQIADLELASRGGGPSGGSEDTAALLAVLQISG